MADNGLKENRSQGRRTYSSKTRLHQRELGPAMRCFVQTPRVESEISTKLYFHCSGKSECHGSSPSYASGHTSVKVTFRPSRCIAKSTYINTCSQLVSSQCSVSRFESLIEVKVGEANARRSASARRRASFRKISVIADG